MIAYKTQRPLRRQGLPEVAALLPNSCLCTLCMPGRVVSGSCPGGAGPLPREESARAGCELTAADRWRAGSHRSGTGRSALAPRLGEAPPGTDGEYEAQASTGCSPVTTSTTAEPSKPTSCRVVIYLQREMSGDTCLCPASGAKPKLSSFKGGGLGNKYVQLNVGGSLYYTTVRALTRHDTMLKAMFSGRMEVLTDKEGWILIDRCGKHFGTILNYLRDDTITLPQNRQEIKELMAEAKYYLIQGLVNMCQTALQDKKDSYEPVCNIPVITSLKEEERLIESSTKPVVKLLYNRSNNKYSYTSNSDDHLLKNIELFDKLSLRFNGRVLFIKDVIGDEICCWSFYGQGRKLAEVCCTSIVYATEKKQTKVEFPEARIYEETLNVLLYETPRVPDNSLLEATSRSRSQASPSEDEETFELRDRVRRIHVKRYSTYDDRQLSHQSNHRD